MSELEILINPNRMYNKTMRRLFTHPSEAIKHIRRLVRDHKKVCVNCGVIESLVIHHTDKRKVITYQCKECKKTFSELYGTIFYKSKIPLDVWCKAILIWIQCTGSVSAAQTSRMLGISHPTAWRMLMKIRTYIDMNMERSTLTNYVEADEAWFGKKSNQDIVMGIVERDTRKLVFECIQNLKEKTLYPLVEKHVKKGSYFYTDSRITYSATSIYYKHRTTNHSKGEFARRTNNQRIHSNTIEQIWGDVKGIIRTIHHGVSKKYRKLYLSQYIFRYQYLHSTNLFFKTLHTIFKPTYCLI